MNFNSIFEELDKIYQDDVVEDELAEAADDDIVDDVVEGEELAEEEPTQLVIECAKCGALGIKAEADIATDEESGLANVDEACPFCEEAAGYKIIGAMVPYEAEGAEVVEESCKVNEDVADWYRKKFDKPASTKTQQAWEDELNDDSISLERRKQLEKKFLQQRDWEKRHPEANK